MKGVFSMRVLCVFKRNCRLCFCSICKIFVKCALFLRVKESKEGLEDRDCLTTHKACMEFFFQTVYLHHTPYKTYVSEQSYAQQNVSSMLIAGKFLNNTRGPTPLHLTSKQDIHCVTIHLDWSNVPIPISQEIA